MKILRVLLAATGLIAALCGPISAGPTAHTLTVDGLTRTYTVYAPAGYDGHRPLPVVVMLHGAGATGAGVIAETAWGEKADREGFLAVFPDAMRAEQAAPPAFLTNPQLWNDGSGRGQGFLRAVDDVRFLDLMLTDLAKRYAVDNKAIFLTGFSSGASLAFRAAALLPDRFAAIAPVAGPCWPLPSGPPSRAATPTLFIAGTVDPLNPLDGGTISLPWGSF
ncbi:MAG TPA: PHB depolymerase family esterase, partial [Negativicutes bacterium]|nr:PHB depolymerase family esterase [Negativicutes bacterium]